MFKRGCNLSRYLSQPATGPCDLVGKCGFEYRGVYRIRTRIFLLTRYALSFIPGI